MSEFLGERRVQRSAFAVTTGERLTIYLGVCEQHNRPVRHDTQRDMGKTAYVPCPAGEHEVKAERLVAVETALECDGSCRSARRNFCSCGCGGVNHGRTWTRGYLMAHCEVVESEVEKYRAEQERIKVKREVRREAAETRRRREFEEWSESHQDLVTWLLGEHPFTGNFLADMTTKVRQGEILSENMIAALRRIWTEERQRAERDRQRDAQRAEQQARGAGDQSALVPGVYKRDGKVFVVKGNKSYLSWRKNAPEAPRPAGARLYAKELVESAARVTEAGTEIPFELVYSKGAIFDLSLRDRMPLAEAEVLATRYASCIVCGRRLKAAQSVRDAIGPVCRGYFGEVLGGAA